MKGPLIRISLVLSALLAACAGDRHLSKPSIFPMQKSADASPETLTLSSTPELPEIVPIPSATFTSSPQPSPKPTSTETPMPVSVTRLPDASQFTWQIVVEGFDQPLGLVNAMDGSGRLFVVEKEGLIWIVLNGTVLPRPFLDLRDRVSIKGSTTRGLLGLAFHPRFTENRSFFVHYTDALGDSVIARYYANQDLSVGDPDSEAILLKVSPPVGEHNGGELAFGPDGYLYVALGDGGGPGNFDREGNAQNTQTLLGALLRLDVDGAYPYGIPANNPFAKGSAQSGKGLPELWVYGLRNPWRFSFDPVTGDLYIGDVGENKWEEINFLPAGNPGGVNFGWNYREGAHRFRGEPEPSLVLVDPVVEYDHSQGCSVIGGLVYRGQALPEWVGVYLYGDFCQGKVWGLLHKPDGSWLNELLFETQTFITAFGRDEAGEIYLVSFSGKIFKLIRKTSSEK